MLSWEQISPTMTDTKTRQRLLLLCTTTGYQTQAFVEAAEKLGLAVVFATDRCHEADPALTPIGEARAVACWHTDRVGLTA